LASEDACASVLCRRERFCIIADLGSSRRSRLATCRSLSSTLSYSASLCGILWIPLRLALMPGEVNRRGESEVFAEDAESNFRRALLWYAFGMAGRPVTSSSQSPQLRQSPLGRRLWWLIAGRAAAAVLLLLMAAAWKWNSQTNSINSSRAVTPLMLSVAGLTLAYCIARLAWKNFLAQARLQILFDVLLVTWLVWISG